MRRAPWLKSVWAFGSAYIIPNVDTVVIGGTADMGCWSTELSDRDSEKILAEVAEVFPSVRLADVVCPPPR